MSRRLDELDFERVVREMLDERGPAGGVPAPLMARIDGVTRRPSTGWQPRTRAALVGALRVAGVAAAAVAVAIVVLWLTQRVPAQMPAASPPTATPRFDPSITGPGIVGDVPHTLGWVPWVVAVVAVAVLAVAVIRANRIWRVAALLVASLVLLGANAVANQQGPAFGHAHGPLLNVREGLPPVGVDVESAYYVTAAPGEPFGVAFNVRNPGPLPIQVLGLDAATPLTAMRRWTAVWIYQDQTGAAFPAADAATPFRPVALRPGEFVSLYVVGRAGECAYGSGADESTQDAGLVSGLEDFKIAYAVVGLSAVETVQTPFIITEPQQPDCSAER